MSHDNRVDHHRVGETPRRRWDGADPFVAVGVLESSRGAVTITVPWSGVLGLAPS
jgi:hypothetical protein